MIRLDNDVASFRCAPSLVDSITRLCMIVRENPFILEPVRGMDERAARVLSGDGFLLYPTVRKTTLLYDVRTDTFFKILHHDGVKNRLRSLFSDRAKVVYHLSAELISKGIKVPVVLGYGRLKRGRKSIFVMQRLEGESLYDILIKQGGEVSEEGMFEVIEGIAGLHTAGYWLRDAHPSHIFMDESGLSGFIDIDGIRRNTPLRLKRLAKDLVWLNHPALPLDEKEKSALLEHYVERMGIRGREKLIRLVTVYSGQRWKA